MSDDENNDPPTTSAFQRIWHELRRRKVIRVGSVYLITGWLIIQVAESTFASFGIPDWAFRFVTLMVLLGLPVALILAWALELTPDGIKATRPLATNKDLADEPKALTKKRNWTTYAFGALLPTLIFGSLAMFFYIQARNAEPVIDPAAARDEVGQETRMIQSIAVMPLVNMSSHDENAYFAGGIHEDVLTNLSRIEGLQVISRTSMLRYATTDMTLREIGSELGVDYIVEGSVRRIGSHVRVTVQLINAHNDLHLWANNYERELVDEFATQSAIAREISDSIHLELQPESVGTLEGMPTTSVKAYDLFVKAESLEKTEGETEESMTRRRDMLELAVTEDPDFVEAWAVLKRVYDLQLTRLRARGWYVKEGDDINAVAEDIRTRSQRALDKAIALDPDDPETLLSRAVDHIWPKSQEEMRAQKVLFDRIIATHPEHAKVWYHLGHWHSHLEDQPEHDLDSLEASAAAAFEEALRLDPFNARMVGAVLTWYRDRGYQEDVDRLSERLVQIVPETAADRRLARVSWGFKSRQIRSAFLETADESYIQEYENGWKEAIAAGDYATPNFRYLDDWRLSALRNDTDRLIELAQVPIDLNESKFNPLIFSILRSTGMEILVDQSELEQARLIARSVLEHQAVLRAQDVTDCSCYLGAIAQAHAVLGDIEEARRWAEVMLDTEYLDLADKTAKYAHMDLEQAVASAFAELSRNPNWNGFDRIAYDYIFHREFLAHPKVQQYYLNEGKWIEFLAARVPEYVKYTGATAN